MVYRYLMNVHCTDQWECLKRPHALVLMAGPDNFYPLCQAVINYRLPKGVKHTLPGTSSSRCKAKWLWQPRSRPRKDSLWCRDRTVRSKTVQKLGAWCVEMAKEIWGDLSWALEVSAIPRQTGLWESAEDVLSDLQR